MIHSARAVERAALATEPVERKLAATLFREIGIAVCELGETPL
jgi:hypothetical protein